MNSGERMKSSTRRRTTTSLFAVSRTTTLECAMVVQHGRSTAEKFDDPDNNRCLRKHIGRNPSSMKSIWNPRITIETCDIYRKKHSCRCYVLLELHKTISVPPRLFDAKNATTLSRDFKHTKCHHHLDLIRSITMWESMCSRSLTQLACASQP